MDNAQKTRYISFNMEFDHKVWARWAEEAGIDSRCINFVLAYPELMNKVAGVQKVNARSMVTFFNTISGYKDFSDSTVLAKILNIASGCFTTENNEVGAMFTTFIANKMDKLVSPEEMVTKSWATLEAELMSCIYDGTTYRADIASILVTRFTNYVNVLFNAKGTKSDPIIDRILELTDDKRKQMLLTEDLVFSLVKSISTKHPSRCRNLMNKPHLVKRILS